MPASALLPSHAACKIGRLLLHKFCSVVSLDRLPSWFFEVYCLLRNMKVSALAVLAAFAVPTGAEIYLKEQFNDKVRYRILCPLVKVTLAVPLRLVVHAAIEERSSI
jgi:hypothetical protein